MSYESEILVSEDPRILEEILNPDTKTVSWDASNDDELLEAVNLSASFAKAHDFKWKTLNGSESNMYIHAGEAGVVRLRNFMEAQERKLRDIVIAADFSGEFCNHQIRTFDPETESRSTGFYEPHIDVDDRTYPIRPILALFFSFNKHMQSTLCVPRDFAGVAGNGVKKFFYDADLEKAVALPGLSVSIVKVSEQVHCAPWPTDFRCTGLSMAVGNQSFSY